VNGNDLVDIGDTFSYELPAVQTSTTGFYYLNIHLDFGLEGTTGWTKAGPDGANAINSFDPDLYPDPGLPDDAALLLVDDDLDLEGFDFSAKTDGTLLADSDYEIFSNINYKKSWGVGGLVEDSGNPVEGVQVGLFDSDGNLVGDALTDAQGWYPINYQHKGKASEYYVQMDFDGGGYDDASDPFTLGGGVKYVEVNGVDGDVIIG
jgi:hypothetical protein